MTCSSHFICLHVKMCLFWHARNVYSLCTLHSWSFLYSSWSKLESPFRVYFESAYKKTSLLFKALDIIAQILPLPVLQCVWSCDPQTAWSGFKLFFLHHLGCVYTFCTHICWTHNSGYISTLACLSSFHVYLFPFWIYLISMKHFLSLPVVTWTKM